MPEDFPHFSTSFTSLHLYLFIIQFMKDLAIAERYAKALFELALEEKLEMRAESDLAGLISGLRAEKEFMQFFQNPMIAFKEKETVLRNLAAGSVIPISPLVIRFLILLIKKHRFGSLESIAEAYHHLLNQSAHFEEVVITTARPLRSELRASLEKILEKKIGERIISETKVNPQLIGGIQIQIRNRLWDGSVRTALEDLKKMMVG